MAAPRPQKTLFFDTAENKLIEKDAEAREKWPGDGRGTFTFAGIEDTYFAAVFLPKDNRTVRIQTLSDTVAADPGRQRRASCRASAVGGDGRNQFSLFVGPKDVDLLRRVDPKLEQVVDFGWFSILAKPLFLTMHWLNDKYVHNYGWSIMLLTIVDQLSLCFR